MSAINLVTNNPVALSSWDHRQPLGTVHDNHSNPLFNAKVYKAFGGKKPLRIVDLGCAGGGMVKSFLDDGHIAVGLEGCDYNLKTGRAEWAALGGKNLFTCDCVAPFHLYEGNANFEADLVTAWEFLEHIYEDDLPFLFENVHRLLKPPGLWLMSIAHFTSPPHHVNVHQRDWWEGVLKGYGFKLRHSLCDHQYFAHNEWIRCDEPFSRRSQLAVEVA